MTKAIDLGLEFYALLALALIELVGASYRHFGNGLAPIADKSTESVRAKNSTAGVGRVKPVEEDRIGLLKIFGMALVRNRLAIAVDDDALPVALEDVAGLDQWIAPMPLSPASACVTCPVV